MTLQLEERPIDLESLRKGKLVPGDNMVNSVSKMPAWVDKDKLERSRELYKEYSACIQFGHMSGLMMIFLYTKAVEPFLFTGQSSNFVSLLRRYIATADHVRKWYTGDILNPEDEAHKSLMIVKNMHKNIARKMNDNPSSDYVYVSQFSMSMTQFAFVGLTVLFPERMGIGWNDKDMECFLHLWRCVGYILGMDDKYNICAGSRKEAVSLFQDILENEIKPGIEKPRYESVKMARDIITVFRCLAPVSWQSLSEYWADVLSIPRDFTLGLFDWLVVLWFRFSFGVLLWYRWTRLLLNFRSQWAFKRIINNMPYYENVVLNYEKQIYQVKGKSD